MVKLTMKTLSVSVLFCFVLVLQSVATLQIPDQVAYIGRVYYYRLPLSAEEVKSTKEITLSETTSGADGLPEWLFMRRSSSRIEFIGLPAVEHKRMHFFHMKIVKHDGTRLDDVFVLDVVDSPMYSSSSSVDSAVDASHRQKECILRLTTPFATVNDVWRVLAYLMPDGLDSNALDADTADRNSVGDDDEHWPSSSSSKNYNEFVDGQSTRVHTWLTNLVNVVKTQDNDGHFKYFLTLDKQECEYPTTRRVNDFTVKLRKMGIDYHVIKIVRLVILFLFFLWQYMVPTQFLSESATLESDIYQNRFLLRV